MRFDLGTFQTSLMKIIAVHAMNLSDNNLIEEGNRKNNGRRLGRRSSLDLSSEVSESETPCY